MIVNVIFSFFFSVLKNNNSFTLCSRNTILLLSIQNMPQFLQVKFIKFSKLHEIPIIQNRI